jgi:hypothetical protein
MCSTWKDERIFFKKITPSVSVPCRHHVALRVLGDTTFFMTRYKKIYIEAKFSMPVFLSFWCSGSCSHCIIDWNTGTEINWLCCTCTSRWCIEPNGLNLDIWTWVEYLIIADFVANVFGPGICTCHKSCCRHNAWWPSSSVLETIKFSGRKWSVMYLSTENRKRVFLKNVLLKRV